MGGRKALVVATYEYADGGLRRLAAPQHDAESFASVLGDPAIAGFDVTMLVNQPHHVVGEAIADFCTGARRDDLTLLYFTGHGLKDDEGRFYLAMTNTRRSALMFTAISGAQLNDAMDASPSRRKVLVLDCCYSGAFPAGRAAKADEGVQTLERFQGRGRAVLTASDATQYAFEGDDLQGSGTSSVFTRYLVEAIRTGAADLDEDGDIALDELYSYVSERVVSEMPQQRPKKQEDVDGRIIVARNVHWTLPAHLRHAIDSPIAAQRLSAVDQLAHLHRVGNDVVRAAVAEQVAVLAADDSRSVSAAATTALGRIGADRPAAVLPASSAPPRAAAPVEAAAVPVEVPPRPPPVPPPRAPRPASGEPAPVPDARPPEGPGQLPLVVSLVLLGGVLLVLSRLLIFESTYASYAVELVHWISWMLGAGLPVLAALQLLVLNAAASWALPVAGGLVAGAAVCQLDLVLATGAYAAHPDNFQRPGPGWWSALLGAVVLLGAAVVLLRRPGLRARPGLRSDWRAFLGLLLVAGGLLASLSALQDAWPWTAFNEAALLLAAVCLPVTVLDLTRDQRRFALAAVTVLGAWMVSGHVAGLIRETYPVDAPAEVVAIVATLCSVAGCWLAQARASRRPAGPDRVPAASR